MESFALEHSKLGYWADYVAYGVAVLLLAALLLLDAPRGQSASMIVLAAGSVASWTLIEYAMRRFILHGLEPFRSWHAAHHERPRALMSAPTWLSASLIIGLVFLSAWLVAGAFQAGAVTLGVTVGYLAYALTHHATHHWPSDSAWLKKRKLWHARHHHADAGFYGVSSSFWDRVFGTLGQPRSR